MSGQQDRKGPSRAACEQARAYSAAHDGLSLVILHDGNLILEDYPCGDAETAHPLHSGTKSFVGVMAAAAVQDGLLMLDEPVSDSIPDWREDTVKARVTIRQLLNLTAGLPSQIGIIPTYDKALLMPFNAAPGSTFQYGPAPFQVFGEVMRRKLRAAGSSQDPLDYVQERIFGPIGLQYADWIRDTDGMPRLPSGAVLTARQWARFGEFIRAGGAVEGTPLVDPVAFAEMFEGSQVNPAYGMTWWLPRPSPSEDMVTRLNDASNHADELPSDLVMANGAGHQMLYVMASLKLVVVRQARLDMARLLREARPEGPGPGPDAWSNYAFLSTLISPEGLK